MLFRDQPSMKYRIRNWFRDLWNKFDAAIFLCMFLSVILRCSMLFYEGDFRWVRVLYSVTIVLCFLRCLQFFYAFPSIGPKVIMIQKMMTDMLPFLAIVLVFVIGFGVAFHANIFPNAPADWSILANVLYFPYFHIFGELFLDNLEGEEVDGCVKNETQKRNGLITPCPEKTPAALSMFLAVYLILTNILLVNLLIAMFSYKFQKVEELSLNAWRLNRLSLVHEYCDRSCLAPPLIIFDHAFRVLRTCCASKHDILLEQKYNAFRWELSPEDCWRLTLFEKNAAEKCLLPAANVSKEINGKWLDRDT
ncbi:transient receptor potential cation channel subfamily M member 3-like isoform X2 [Littorina saxatilis]|uniref:transient receptor potential cation channel subfamily M member 3-like isoform X2 n=1 Tax=Littorina saxatilis TaxID=31220 RepID=UPI0038B5C67C